MKTYQFEDTQIQYIADLLSKQPYIEVVNILASIQSQYNNQIEQIDKDKNK